LINPDFAVPWSFGSGEGVTPNGSLIVADATIGPVLTAQQFDSLLQSKAASGTPLAAYPADQLSTHVVPGIPVPGGTGGFPVSTGLYPLAYYTGSVGNPQILMDSAGNSLSFPTQAWAEINITAQLFTAGVDVVNFNNLTTAQQSAIAGGADLYNALGGNDTVTLPNAAHYQLAGPPRLSTVTWNPATTFNAGPGDDTIIIPAGPSSGIIDGDAGTDTVRYTGGTFSLNNYNYNATTPATYGSYTITYNGNTVDSTGKGGVQVTVANSQAKISDVLKNVEYVSIGGVKIPLEAIQINVNITGPETGVLYWTLNGQPKLGGSEKVYFDPTLPIQTGTYQTIYRTNAHTGAVIELSDPTTGTSDFPSAEFVQIHVGNSPQDSAGCIVGSQKAGTSLAQVFSLLQKLPPQLLTTSKQVTNHISTNSAYIQNNLTFGAQPRTTDTLVIKTPESFYQLPIPITVVVTGDTIQQPKLNLSPTFNSVRGEEECTLSLNNFTAPALDRSIKVLMQVSLSPGESMNDIKITGKNVSAPNSAGRFTVTIPYQVITSPSNPTPSAPTAPTANFFASSTTGSDETATFTMIEMDPVLGTKG
jgi:hypothetical protein